MRLTTGRYLLITQDDVVTQHKEVRQSSINESPKGRLRFRKGTYV